MSTDPSRAEGSAALRRLLAEDEELRWLGKPHWRRMLADLPQLAVVVLFVVGVIVVFVGFNAAAAVAFFELDVGPVWPFVVGVFGGLYATARRLYANAEYAVTDDRLIKFGGALGRDYSAVDWRNVRDIEVEVGALDRLFDTGTIHVVTAGRGGITLRYVPTPYERVSELEAIRAEGRDA